MQTHFAPAERAGASQLEQQVISLSGSPVIGELMRVVNGLLAILNEQRQIIAINTAFLKKLGLAEDARVLGLRPGEAIQCIHVGETPGGCGTTRYCSSCGAAVAIVTALSDPEPAERVCVATVRQKGKTVDLRFNVRACTMTIEDQKIVLLFMQDVTEQERRAALERVFFHDISNIVTGLSTASCLMSLRDDQGLRSLVRPIQKMVSRLEKEIRIQSILSKAGEGDYQPEFQTVSAEEVVDELRCAFATCPVVGGVFVRMPEPVPDIRFLTDLTLLVRILTNMLKNALEATAAGGEVRLNLECAERSITFSAWNRQFMPEDIARRIFQGHFSTKREAGRGLGTYAMRLLGERYLKGRVDFTTSEQEGTWFRITLPR